MFVLFSESESILLRRQGKYLPDVTFTEADGRPTAIAVGLFGIAFLAGEMIIFFLCDIPRLCQHIRHGPAAVRNTVTPR